MDWASFGSGVIGALIGAVASIALTIYSERRRDKNQRIREVRTRSERAAVEALDLIVQLRGLADEPEMAAPHSRQMERWHAWDDRRSELIAQLQVRAYMVAHTGLRETLSFVADVLNRHNDIASFGGFIERRSRYIVTWHAMKAAGAVLREEKTLPAEPAEFGEFREAMEAAEEAYKERDRF